MGPVRRIGYSRCQQFDDAVVPGVRDRHSPEDRTLGGRTRRHMGRGPFKVSVLGDWRSGRSSVVSVLSGKPCPNHPGIQVTRWWAQPDGALLEIWDVNSRSTLESLGQTFLAHAHGLVAVADVQREGSLLAATRALQAAFSMIGPRPACLLLNHHQGPLPQPESMQLPRSVSLHAVHALRGDGVVEAFTALARRLAEN